MRQQGAGREIAQVASVRQRCAGSGGQRTRWGARREPAFGDTPFGCAVVATPTRVRTFSGVRRDRQNNCLRSSEANLTMTMFAAV